MTDSDDRHDEPLADIEGGQDAELEHRIADIERRAQEARARHHARVEQDRGPERMTPEGARSLALGMTIAYSILGIPMFGFLVGWLVDKQLESQFWAGALTLIGAVAGIAFAFFAVQRGERRR